MLHEGEENAQVNNEIHPSTSHECLKGQVLKKSSSDLAILAKHAALPLSPDDERVVPPTIRSHSAATTTTKSTTTTNTFTPSDLQQRIVLTTPSSFETVEMSPFAAAKSTTVTDSVDVVERGHGNRHAEDEEVVNDGNLSEYELKAPPNINVGIGRLVSDEDDAVYGANRVVGAEGGEPKEDEEEGKEEEGEEAKEGEEESEEDRIRREMEASERLAWEMMQQESLETYNMQIQFMQENAESLSAEDLAAIQAAVSEMGQPIPSLLPHATENQGEGEEGEGDDDGNEEGNQSDVSDPDQWDYERLLRLGEVIGDVKTERWRLRSQNVIDKLPKITFGEVLAQDQAASSHDSLPPPPPSTTSASNESDVHVNLNTSCVPAQPLSLPSAVPLKKLRLDHRCTVCMDAFEEPDELTVLRCSHYFHSLCAAGWLRDHNSCPFCKQKVTESP